MTPVPPQSSVVATPVAPVVQGVTINSKTFQRVSSVARQAAAATAVVVSLIPSIGLPGSTRDWLLAIGGLLLTVEHYVSDPSTGNPIV